MTDAQKCLHIKKKCRSCGWQQQGNRQATCPQCGEDLRCGNYPVAGYTLCKYHGGPNPQAGYYGAGTLVNGNKSQFQLVRLAAKYREMQSSGTLLSNRQTIELIDTRIRQLLERVDAEEAPERVSRLYALWNEYEDQLDAGSDEARITRKRIADEFEKIYHDYQAWKQLMEILDLRGKAVEREVKIIEKMHGIITMEDAYNMAAKMLGAAMKVIGDDPQKLKEMQFEFIRITGERSDKLSGSDGDETDWGADAEVGGEEGPGDMDQEGILHSGDKE